jgi:hypothetical protein
VLLALEIPSHPPIPPASVSTPKIDTPSVVGNEFPSFGAGVLKATPEPSPAVSVSPPTSTANGAGYLEGYTSGYAAGYDAGFSSGLKFGANTPFATSQNGPESAFSRSDISTPKAGFSLNQRSSPSFGPSIPSNAANSLDDPHRVGFASGFNLPAVQVTKFYGSGPDGEGRSSFGGFSLSAFGDKNSSPFRPSTTLGFNPPTSGDLSSQYKSTLHPSSHAAPSFGFITLPSPAQSSARLQSFASGFTLSPSQQVGAGFGSFGSQTAASAKYDNSTRTSTSFGFTLARGTSLTAGFGENSSGFEVSPHRVTSFGFHSSANAATASVQPTRVAPSGFGTGFSLSARGAPASVEARPAAHDGFSFSNFVASGANSAQPPSQISISTGFSPLSARTQSPPRPSFGCGGRDLAVRNPESTSDKQPQTSQATDLGLGFGQQMVQAWLGRAAEKQKLASSEKSASFTSSNGFGQPSSSGPVVALETSPKKKRKRGVKDTHQVKELPSFVPNGVDDDAPNPKRPKVEEAADTPERQDDADASKTSESPL